MIRTKLSTAVVWLLIATFLLAACSAAPTAEPTLDANAVYTQAAATVAAGLAQTLASQPTNTPVPPTNTPIPTATLASGNATAVLPGPADLTAGTPLATVSALTPMPTNTVATGGGVASTAPDQAEWIDQYPDDGDEVEVGVKFLVKYILKNTGTTTWTTAYTLRFYAGDKLGAPNDTNLTKTVAPNETVDIYFEMQAPSSAGTSRSIFTLTNADGQNFYYVYLDLKYVKP